MRPVAIIGVGMTHFGVSENTQVEMFAEAATDAVQDANIKLKEIQAVYVGNADGNVEEGQSVIAAMCASELGLKTIPSARFEGACSSGTLAIINACTSVASGLYDIVLAGGTERQRVMSTALATRIMGTGVHARYETPTGLSFPGIFGMLAHLYASKYSIQLSDLKEAMARVSFKSHKWGAINPKAQFYGKKITMDQIYQSAMVASPLQVFDCCPISDGAAATIVVSADVAKKLHNKPVNVIGIGQGSSGALCSQRDITRIHAREASVKRAYTMAGLTPKDIDICELHDCFTIGEIVATEGLGFFEPGDGYKAIIRGDTDMGGKIPVNISGGIKAKGHPIGATGAAQVYEIVKQLRGLCNERQVEGAKIGLTDTMGGSFASIAHLILKRGW